MWNEAGMKCNEKTQNNLNMRKTCGSFECIIEHMKGQTQVKV